jgi:ketosteroid isomerase-like protein
MRRRDVEAFLAFMDPDVECVPLLMEPAGASYRGHDGIRRWLDELFGVFPDFSADVQEVRDFGDLLVVAARTQGQGIGSDVPFRASVWQVVEVRDGKVIRWRNYWSEAEALEAAGRRD